MPTDIYIVKDFYLLPVSPVFPKSSRLSRQPGPVLQTDSAHAALLAFARLPIHTASHLAIDHNSKVQTLAITKIVSPMFR